MATCVNLLSDRGISAARCYRAEVASAGVRVPVKAVTVIRYGQKIPTEFENNL